jgi:hypothetical protein
MGFDVKPAGKSRERARGSDHPMARRNDRHRVSAVCRTDSARRRRLPNLPGDLSIRSRLSERDRQQCVPDCALETRSGSGKVELHGELFPLSSKVFRELALGLDEHRMSVVLGLDVQPHTTRPVVLPQDSGETVVSRNQRESPDWRIHHLVDAPLLCFLIHFGHNTPFAMTRSPEYRAGASIWLAVFGHLNEFIVVSENG